MRENNYIVDTSKITEEKQMFFDTHAHYDDKAFDEDRDSLLAALPEAGVTLVIDPGCDVKSSRGGDRACCAL